MFGIIIIVVVKLVELGAELILKIIKDRDMKKENRRESSNERMDAKQEGARKQKGVFGRELSMGIPDWDKELNEENGAPMRNRFSAQHDVSMAEAMRVVKGGGSSFQEEMRDQRKTRREERDRREV